MSSILTGPGDSGMKEYCRIIESQKHRSIESQNHRMIWVGGNHPAPTPAMGRAAPHQLRLPRAPSNLALSTSRDGAPQLLWAVCYKYFFYFYFFFLVPIKRMSSEVPVFSCFLHFKEYNVTNKRTCPTIPCSHRAR